jgi:hypothetical protein
MAPQKLCYVVVRFLRPILICPNGKFYIRILLIDRVNEILDVCCMCCNDLISLSLLMLTRSRAHRALHDYS